MSKQISRGRLRRITINMGVLVALALAGCGGGEPGIAPELPEDEQRQLEQELEAQQNGEAGASEVTE